MLGTEASLGVDMSLGAELPLGSEVELDEDPALPPDEPDEELEEDAACATESIVNAGIVYAAKAAPPRRAIALRRERSLSVLSGT
jgi:hypothetical protein